MRVIIADLMKKGNAGTGLRLPSSGELSLRRVPALQSLPLTEGNLIEMGDRAFKHGKTLTSHAMSMSNGNQKQALLNAARELVMAIKLFNTVYIADDLPGETRKSLEQRADRLKVELSRCAGRLALLKNYIEIDKN